MKTKQIIKKIIKYVSLSFCLFMLYCAFYPLQLTRYTLSDNNNNIIVFQSMEHIAVPDFYKNVEDDIKSYTSNGYTFLYEGIRPGKEVKSGSAEDNSLNIPDYEIMSNLLGLTSQGAGDYFYIASKLGYNADVDADFLLKKFIEKGLINSDKNVENNTPQNSTSNNDSVKSLYPYKNIIAFVFLPVSRVASRFASIEEYFAEANNSYSPEDEIIIVERNKVLYDNVKICHCTKIYINYGAAHFNNFYNILKANNDSWHIVEEKNYTAF